MKRKSAPAKDVQVKESKKAKIDSGKKGKESKSVKKPAKKVESESEEESESEDGGAALESESADGSDSDTEMKEVEGIHPDRVKAVAANSMLFLTFDYVFLLTCCRSIIKRGTCETEAAGKRKKSRKTFSRSIGTHQEDLGTSTSKVACPQGGEKAIG